MKRAGLYVRVSTQEQKIHGMSVDNQIEADMAGIVITPKQVPELPEGWKEIYAALSQDTRQVFWKKLIDSIYITSETKTEPRIVFRMGL